MMVKLFRWEPSSGLDFLLVWPNKTDNEGYLKIFEFENNETITGDEVLNFDIKN